MMDVWIGILQLNGYDRNVARCLLYSLVLVFDLIPITGPANWATSDPASYKSVLNETAPITKGILKCVLKRFPNILGLFAVGQAAFDGFPSLLEGTDVSMLNTQSIIHPCHIYQGWTYESSRTRFLEESVRVLTLVVRTNIIINDECKKLIHVHKDRMNGVGGRKESKASTTVCDTWDDRLEEVPTKSLGDWLRKQRHQYLLYKDEGIEAEDIGLDDDLRHTWDNRLEELARYKAENGHIRVPVKLGQLGEWVRRQRYQYLSYKEGKKSQMTVERASRLKDIGMVYQGEDEGQTK
ncbi:hypothetical protein ACHAW5_001661 [Stephanodiscus triporus]|uniref:Helicase-associated domain-containing protein n=1 Tax=Stephanodiscus triporus TaxID=2934178 RepID=A0ABD3QFS8_9STRA